VKANRPEFEGMLSQANKSFFGITSLARELGLSNDRRIINALHVISSNPGDVASVREVTAFAMEYMRNTPQFWNTYLDKNPFEYPRGRASGPIVFGCEYNPIDDMKYRVGLSIEELTQNVLIAGRAGSGKTTTNYSLAMELNKRKTPFWWIDFKQDGRHLTRVIDDLIVFRPGNFKLNPPEPPIEGIAHKWIQIITDIFFDAFFLGGAEASRSFFMDILDSLYSTYGVYEGSDCYPSLFEVDYALNEASPMNKKRSHDARQRMRTIRNRLRPMLKLIGNMFDCSKGHLSKDLMEMNVVFEFDGLAPEYQKFLVNMIFHWVFTYRMES